MGLQGLWEEVRKYVIEKCSLWATTTQRECDGRRKTEWGLKGGVPPLGEAINSSKKECKFYVDK